MFLPKLRDGLEGDKVIPKMDSESEASTLDPGTDHGVKTTSPRRGQGGPTLGIDLDELLRRPSRPRVLIVDDDADTVEILKLALRKAGMDVMGALDGYQALTKCAEMRPDLVLLDLMMPEFGGLEVFRRLREFSEVPVVMLSARSSKGEIVTGLESGVEDYLPKPFHTPELIARIRAVLRRSQPASAEHLAVFPREGLVIKFDTRQVMLGGKQVKLPQKEFALLETLAASAPRPVSYEAIAMRIWGEDKPLIRNRIRYLVFLLRRRLEVDPSQPKLILNFPQFGYQLDCELGDPDRI